MKESLAVQLPECNVVLPGAAENIAKDLQTINSKLIMADEQRNAEVNRAKIQKAYDEGITDLAAKWFNVKSVAITGLTHERRKELEDLVLRHAKEISQRRGLFYKIRRVFCRLSEDDLMSLGFITYVPLATAGLICGAVLDSMGIVLASVSLLMPLMYIPRALAWPGSVFHKTNALLKAKDFLDNNEPKQIN